MRQRFLAPEIMDQPGLSPALHAAALAGLARINRASATSAFLWRTLDRHCAGLADVRVLDLACGRGDVGIDLAARAARRGVRIHLLGIDASPTAVELAASHARARGVQARFVCHDVLGPVLPDGYDVVMSTLFLHHLERSDAVALIARMGRAAGSIVVVDDLIRGRRALATAWLGCRLLSRSPIVHADGPASVRAAFTPAELGEIAAEAGLTGASIERHWPFRMALVGARP